MQRPTPEQIGELEAKYGTLAQFNHDEYTVVVRRPKRADVLHYKSTLGNPMSNELLLRKLVVWPAKEALETFLDDWPFACDAVINDPGFMKFVGLKVEQDVK